jgi:putative addiction module antidote
MLALKVHKVGNSLNLRLPKDAVSTLRVSEGDVVYLTETADGGYRITPFDPEFERQMELAEEGMKKYRNALRELANCRAGDAWASAGRARWSLWNSRPGVA